MTPEKMREAKFEWEMRESLLLQAEAFLQLPGNKGCLLNSVGGFSIIAYMRYIPDPLPEFFPRTFKLSTSEGSVRLRVHYLKISESKKRYPSKVRVNA